MIGAMLTLTVIAFDLNSRLVVAVEGIIRQSLNIQGGSYIKVGRKFDYRQLVFYVS